MTDFLIEEVLVERKMAEIAEKVFILADSTKIENNSLIKICDIENLDLIITDSKLDENILKKYLENGIKIINR